MLATQSCCMATTDNISSAATADSRSAATADDVSTSDVDTILHAKQRLPSLIQQPTLCPFLCLARREAPRPVRMWVSHSCSGGLVAE